MTIKLNFYIDSQNLLSRTDDNAIISQTTNYTCKFTFENEDWENINKFVQFTNSNGETFIGVLGKGLICESSIPYKAYTGCVIKISVYGGCLMTSNQLSLVVTPSGDINILECESVDPDFKDAFIDSYNKIALKFDDAVLDGTDIVFMSNNEEIKRLSLSGIIQQADWNEDDENSPSYIKNKPI